MTGDPPSLDDLRGEIDEIDLAMHDLLMRRTALVDLIARAKGTDTAFIRPGREAQILRRLIARHRGPFPKVVVVRIWREIISALTALQGPFAVAVYVPSRSGDDLRALARGHYGAERPIQGHETAMGVLRAVSDGKATIGVLPLPQAEEVDPWWRSLTRSGPTVPRIIARLPFAANGRRHDGAEALAVALAPWEASGRDRTYLVAENGRQLSRSGLRQALMAVDLEVVDLHHAACEGETPLALIEVEGFLAPDDARLGRLAASGTSPLSQVWVIGGYAVPLSAEELAAETN